MVSGKEESESGFSVLPMRYISVGYRTRCLITYDQAFLLPSALCQKERLIAS